jgi:hypothetical protein
MPSKELCHSHFKSSNNPQILLPPCKSHHPPSNSGVPHDTAVSTVGETKAGGCPAVSHISSAHSFPSKSSTASKKTQPTRPYRAANRQVHQVEFHPQSEERIVEISSCSCSLSLSLESWPQINFLCFALPCLSAPVNLSL